MPVTKHSPELDILRGFAREELAVYATAMFPQFEAPPHLRKVIAALERVDRGESRRLMVFMPPRHGKSLLISQLFPAWYLGRHPNRYVISTTYGDDLSTDFGRAVRNHVDSPQHREIFPECVMSQDTSSAQRFTTEAGGAYFAVGRGGPITGRGAHLLLIDDPLKDKTEAQSETIRGQLKEWYRTVAFTRLMPGGAVVIATTRWHVDDLPGWLLDEHNDQGWEVLQLKAIADSDEPDRTEGEALWPERFPLDVLREIRRLEGTSNWLSLYQQEPVLEGGFMFKRENFNLWQEDVDPQRMNRYVVVDPANSKKKGSDFTAMFVVGLAPDQNFYILDVVYDRLNLFERVDALMGLHRAWKPRRVGYEDYGMQADVQAIKERQQHENYRFEVVPLKGRVSKVERIRRLQAPFEAARIWFPPALHKRNLQGVEEDLVQVFFEREYLKYPAVEHDDMLDALARILDPDLGVIWPREDDEFLPFEARKREGRYKMFDWRKWYDRTGNGSWMSA